MTTSPGDNNNLTIYLLRFDRPTNLTESFHFSEMSTLQVTVLLTHDKKIISTDILAYTNNNIYLDKQITDCFKTIGDFNNFFLNNLEYYIHDCKIEMENGMHLHSHDDGEVTLEFRIGNADQIIIKIFEKYDLDKKLIDILKSKPGHYLEIDNKSNVIRDLENFDDYLNNRRD